MWKLARTTEGQSERSRSVIRHVHRAGRGYGLHGVGGEEAVFQPVRGEAFQHYAQRLLKIDPKFYDAYLTAGITEYMIGSLPFFVNWFVHSTMWPAARKGVERLRLVAREGHYFKPFSKIMLSIIALREKRPQEAQQWLTELARDYPENRLFRKELAKVNTKLGINAN